MAPGDIVLAHQKLAHRISFNHSPFIRYQVYNFTWLGLRLGLGLGTLTLTLANTSFSPSPFACYQVYFRIGAEGRRPEAPLRAGGTYDSFAGLASVTAAGPFG